MPRENELARIRLGCRVLALWMTNSNGVSAKTKPILQVTVQLCY